MKKLLFTFLALMVLGTTAWASSVTKIGNGQFRLDMTMTDIATANSWSSGTKTTFKIGDHIQFVGPTGRANATLYNATTGGKGARVYETQNQYGVTKIGVNGVIDTLTLTYVVGNAGVISLTKDTLGPVPANRRIVSGTKYAIKKDTLYFYVGRTDGTKKDGKCDITNVYAVYTLYPSSITMDETKTVSVGDVFQIGQVAPIGAYQVWSSNNENAVTVDQNGTITAKAAGEATITVTSPTITKSCVITVVAKSEEGTFVESLTKIGTMATWNAGVKNYDGETNGIKWAVRNFQRNTSDMIGGVQGTEIRNDGTNNYIAYQNAQIEGGVKRVAFQWRATDATQPVYFDVDGTIAAEPVFKNELQASADYTSEQYFCREIGMAKNYQFRIRIANKASSTVVFGPLTITPYLLYTTKTAEAYSKDGAYTNTALIDNTGATPTYTISCGADTAEISTAGAVTIKKSAVVTVTASWGNVSTTYTLTMHAKDAPTVTFADQNVTMNQVPFTPTPTSIPASGMGAASYISDNKAVAKVNAATGELTIVGEGMANINVHYEEGAEWASADVSYKVTVTDPMEASVIEDFNDAKYGASATAATLDGKLATWEYQYTRRRYSGNNDFDTLQTGAHATWLNYVTDAHLLTTAELEGGIKRVSFLWNRTSTGDRIVEFVVSTGDDLQTKDTVTLAINNSNIRQIPDFTYNHNFNIKKNSKLYINGTGKKAGKESYMVLGDIKITPYLQYTTKTADMYAIDGAYTHPIINNTNGEGTITYSLEGEGADQIASINDQGAVTAKKDGQVTVKATWGDVTTTYTLNVHMANTGAKFDAVVVNKNIGDSTFTNELTKATPAAATFESSDESVATVDAASGLVTIINGGTTQIKATLASSGAYRDTTLFYTLDVAHTPTEGSYWVEGFDSIPMDTQAAGPDNVSGNDGIYQWSLKNYQRTVKSDTLQGMQGVHIKHNSEDEGCYIKMAEPVEGGIKEVAFDWYAPGYPNPVHFFVKAGENTYEYSRVKVGVKNHMMHFARQFNETSNVALSIYQNKQEEQEQTNIVVFPIKIVPYLLYTVKSAEWKKEDGKFTNNALINNTTGDPVVYSLEDNDGEASIDASTGEVTILGEGQVTVKASWGDVYTTYTLITHVKPIPTVTYDDVEKDMNAAAFTNPMKEEIAGLGTAHYTSSDKAVVKVDEAFGLVTIIGAGVATINVHFDESTTLAAADAEYQVTITDPMEDAVVETFTIEKITSKAAKDTIYGDIADWEYKYIRRDITQATRPDTLRNGKRASRLQDVGGKYDESYLLTTQPMEGGIKRVSFLWNNGSPFVTRNHNFIVIAGSVKDTVIKTTTAPDKDKALAAEDIIYNHNFGIKENVTLSVRNNSGCYALIGDIKVTPYLLYTRKDTTVYAKNCTDYKYFTNDKLINNAEGDVTYSVPENNGVVSINAATGQLTILGEGQTTVTASWEDVTTTYVIHTVLETPVLSFAEKEVSKKIADSPYKQEVTLTTPTSGTVVYSIVDDPAGASINSETGEVTMTAAGVYTIKATFPVQLSYKQGEATYQLTVTEKTVPHISFDAANVDKDLLDAAFTNTLNAPEGVGAVTYVSSNEDVATVDANGQVSMAKTTGSAIITAYAAENEEYAADSAKFTVNVTFTPDASKTWKETFSKRNPKSSKDMTPRPTVGDSAIYNWTLTNYDYNNSDNIEGVIGVRVRYDGSIVCDAMEGGIKTASFRWRASSNTNPIHFTVKADNEPVVVEHAIIPKGQPVEFPFVRKFAKTSNASFSIKVDTAGQPALAYIGCGPITITPYLLFKKQVNKEVSLDLANLTEFNLNDTLINNVDEGTVTFAVDSFTTNVAPTITEGVVTFAGVTKGGKVYVSAKWEQVATTLVLNVKTTPEVNFAEAAPAAQDLINGSYTNELNAPEGVGAITYTSSNKQVATVDNEGKVTFLVAGTTTIIAKVAASDIYNKTEKSYDLTINGYTPAAGEAWVETFSRLAKKDPYETTEQKFQGDSAVYGWKIDEYIRPDATKPFRLRTDGYIKTNGRQEGGMKYVALNWIAAATGNIDFTMKVNNDSYQYKGGVTVNKAYRFEHFFNADSICPLEIKMGSQDITAYMSVVNVTVVPYLLYTKKQVTLDMKSSHTYQMVPQIDNRDNEEAIQYSFKDGDVDFATIDPATGVVTATAGGEVIVKAAWGKVWTSYKLTILNDKSTIYLMRNDGTELADTIVNNCGEAMPLIAQPTREGYRFNAYFTSPDTSVTPGYRFTVTRLDSKTVWVAKRKIGNDSIINYDRKWIYQGASYTLYAQWMPELTITLDNQGATTPGTDKVITAHCPNNNSVNLMNSDITVPAKEGVSFKGYFTEQNGEGIQLIDANGSFRVSVADQQGDTILNQYKMWSKDGDVTLYAYWLREQKEVSDTTAASDIPQWSDVTVNEGGNLVMDDNKTFSSLVIKASASATGTSGQITGATNANLKIQGDAYFDLTLAKNGTADQWHAFTVPFPVDMMNDIYDTLGNKLTNEVNYAIMVYQGDVRAQGKYGWIKVPKTGNTILQPGTFYLMTVDGNYPVIRMKMYGEFSVASNSLPVHQYAMSGEGKTTDAGWNGIGNSQLDYRTVNATVQVLDPETYTFVAKQASEAAQFAVGTPFFYQASAEGTIVLEKETPAAPMRAVSVSKELKNIAVALTNEDYTDRLYISATDGATNEYQIGRDLSKMSMTSTPAVPQIFAQAYNTKLCIMDAPMSGDEAVYPLSLYAPKAGEYTISTAAVAGATLYLFQDGNLIWNLSQGDYTMDLNKGTSTEYELVLKINKADVVTDLDAVNVPVDGIQKFVKDEQLIIIRDGKVYNGVGVIVK